MRPSVIALFLAWGLFGPLRAADTVSYAPAPAWVNPNPVPKIDAGLAEAPVRVLLRNYQVHLTATASEAYFETFIHLQTPQGLQAMSNVVLPWKPDSDLLTVHRVQLLRGSEVIDLLADGQKFEVIRRENNLEYSALDGVLTAALQPGGMQVGDVLNFSYTLKREMPLIGPPELLLAGFSEMPVAQVEVRAFWDKSAGIRWRATPEVVGVKESRKGNAFELTWSATDAEPLKQPTNVPMRFWREPLLEFTGFATWSEVSRRLAPLYAKAAALDANSPLRAEARAIAAAAPDTEARLEAVLKLVQERVRYVFLGMGDGGFNPAAVDVTWQRRFGDCKAKSALLIALLRELGIEAEPVAVNTRSGDYLSNRLPTVTAFDHVLVRARAGGKTWWLDGAMTGTWHRADMTTPNYYWGLPMTARGEGLVRMLAEPLGEPAAVFETDLDARAGIHSDVPFKAVARLRGRTGAAVQLQLAQLTPLRKDEALRQFWKDRYDFVTPTKVGATFDDAAGVLTVSLEGTAEMDWAGGSYATDGLRTGFAAKFAREPGLNVEAPYVVAHPAYTITRQRIQLPAVGTFTITGKDYDVKLLGYHYVRHAKIVERVFEGESSSRSFAAEATAAEAHAAEKTLNAMWKDRVDIEVDGYRVNAEDRKILRTRKYESAANLVWRGNLLLDEGDYDAAFADFDAAVKAKAKSADALAHRGLAQWWRQNHALAMQDLEAAIAIEPRNAVALRGLGVVHQQRGEYTKSIERLSESLREDPDNQFAHYWRAVAYVALREADKAIADADKVIGMDTHYVAMYDLKARLLSIAGRRDEAAATLAAMLAANADSERALAAAASRYPRLGNYAQALAAADRLVERAPTEANYLLRAEARNPADTAGRLADAEAALAKNAASPPARLMRANLLRASGKYPLAIEAYTGLITGTKNQRLANELRTFRGVAYARHGDAARARRDFDAALGDADGDQLNAFCWELATGRVQPELALSACDRALARAPKDARISTVAAWRSWCWAGGVKRSPPTRRHWR
jgi:tetratricopeptide (TPR) repeat protein